MVASLEASIDWELPAADSPLDRSSKDSVVQAWGLSLPHLLNRRPRSFGYQMNPAKTSGAVR